VIVADVNVLIDYLLPTSQHQFAVRAYRKDRVWTFPRLWRAEFLNALVNMQTQRMLTLQSADRIWREADKRFSSWEQEPDGALVLALADQYGITAYDAHYVALAHELGVPLVTNDVKSLASKCPESLVIRLASFVLQ
jgi:predicted nucleic acid-binding protein